MLHCKASKRPILAAVSLLGSAMAALIAILGFVSPASATLVSVTVSGTVVHGYDQTGVFGPAGTDLTGDSYVAHYVFDTTLGQTQYGPDYPGGSIRNYAIGGGYYGNASPGVSASVTINGHSADIGAPDYSAAIEGATNELDAYATHVDGYTSNQTWSNIIANRSQIFPFPSSITEPFTYDNVSGAGQFGFWDGVIGYEDVFAYATVSVTGLTIGPVGSVGTVPEPSTWAMMLIGFAGLGFAGYRRAKRNAPAFAD